MAIMSSLSQHLIRERRKKDVPCSQSMECRAEHDNTNDGWLEVLIMLSSAKRNWKTCVVKNVSNIKPCHLSRSLLKSKASS